VAKKPDKKRKLAAIRYVCQCIAEETFMADADPVVVLRKLQGIALLLDPELGDPRTRGEAIERLTELTMLRLRSAAKAFSRSTSEENGGRVKFVNYGETHEI